MTAPDTLLLVTTSYPRWNNGREAAGSFVADLALELAKRVPVRVVAPGDDDKVEQVSPNLSVYRYRAPRRRLVNLHVWNPYDAWRILRTLGSGQAAVRRAIADARVRHMLALWALPPGWWARAVGRVRSAPYSVWMLGSDVWSLGRLPVVRGMLRRVMREAQHRYADGLQLARDSERIGGLPVEFLPTTRALDTREPPPPAAAPPFRLVFIGRWHRNKGVDLLLDALALLDDAEWARIAEVAIYGGGPLHELVRGKAQPMLDANRPLVIGGFIPKPEAEAAIVRADYVVIPSRIESIPVIFSDAMKLGRPVIAMPVGDLTRLVHEAPCCGILANAVSAAALAAALERGLHDPASGFGLGTRRMAERFDMAVIATRLYEDMTRS